MLTEWPPSRSPQSFAQRPVDQVLADLQWLITSPVLINPQASKVLDGWLDDAFFEASWQRCQSGLSAWRNQYLETLNEGPSEQPGVSPLLGTLCGHAGFTPHTKRLGDYFEWLVCLWLYLDPELELLAKQLPIRRPDGSTLGELDFIIRDRSRDKVIHLEVAVKFYLGVDPDLAAPTDWHWRWFGPMQKDRLDLKYCHMQWRQLRHAEQPSVQKVLAERGMQVDECWGMLKGRLYTPWQAGSTPPSFAESLINPMASLGQWLSASDYQRMGAGECLSKYDWLRAEPGGGDDLNPADLQRGPQHIVWRGQPVFVVPDDWLGSAKAIALKDFTELRRLYASAVYELAVDGQALTLRVGGALPQAVNGFVITAYNPGHSRPTAEQNHHRHQALYKHLLQCGYAVQPALGRSVDGLHVEPSWWVQGASWLQLRTLAQAYAQRALLELKQGQCRLRWV